MSEITKLLKDLPPKEIPFSFKEVGSKTKIEYEGNFVIKVPSMKDQSRIGVELAKLGMGMSYNQLDEATAMLNNAIATLSVVVIEAPNWFTQEMEFGLNTIDINIPLKLYSKVSELLDKWPNLDEKR